MEAAITSVLEEHLSRIQRAFHERGFARAGELADRHGALQLTFAKESGGLARLVLLNEAVGTGEGDYRGAIDIVVQSGDRFVRHRVTDSHSQVAFEQEVMGSAIETAVALAESVHEKDLIQTFDLRFGLVESHSQPKDVPSDRESASTRGVQPDEFSIKLLEQLLVFTEKALRLRGSKARRYVFTAEDFVDEAVMRALRGTSPRPDGMALYDFLTGIIRSLISHVDSRAEYEHPHISIEDADDAPGVHAHELPSREDLEAAALAKDLFETFKRTLDGELREYVELRVTQSGSTAEELARMIARPVQYIRNLDRRLARRRALWDRLAH